MLTRSFESCPSTERINVGSAGPSPHFDCLAQLEAQFFEGPGLFIPGGPYAKSCLDHSCKNRNQNFESVFERVIESGRIGLNWSKISFG